MRSDKNFYQLNTILVVAEKVGGVLHEMDSDPAYIFNLGHGVFPDTPPQSVAVAVETVKTYGKRVGELLRLESRTDNHCNAKLLQKSSIELIS